MKEQAANKRANKATLRFMVELADETANYTVARVTRRVPDTLAGLRLDKALARMFPGHSRNRLQRWLREGHVSLDSHAAKPKQKIWGGERVEIRPQPGPPETAFRAEPIALDIVYEDDDVLVINKAAGLVVHPGSGNWKGTLLNALLHRSPQLAAIPRAGIVHRLDKNTSGHRAGSAAPGQNGEARLPCPRARGGQAGRRSERARRTRSATSHAHGRGAYRTSGLDAFQGDKALRPRDLARMQPCYRQNPSDSGAHAVVGASAGWRSRLSQQATERSTNPT